MRVGGIQKRKAGRSTTQSNNYCSRDLRMDDYGKGELHWLRGGGLITMGIFIEDAARILKGMHPRQVIIHKIPSPMKTRG